MQSKYRPEFRLLQTPNEMAKILGTSPESLANQRMQGSGLPYLKCGGRVLYDLDECIAVMRAGGGCRDQVDSDKNAAA